MILETERLYLRHLQFDDAMRMSEYRNKPEVAEYQSWTTYSKEDAMRRIQQCLLVKSLNQVKSDYHLAIVKKKDNLLIGDIFVEILNAKVFVLGYTLDSDYWSMGYASEMVEAFCQYMKKEYGFKKVMCYVYYDNVRSKKLLKRLHFVKFDESYYYNDEGYVKKLR
ncbi:GNAT family N-acetyltransferase [Candidatus Stoquefichus massiliensis]|uniref:GNAT family N-acetyltransferase n=1 Tax=Candidatus Stoquefichus massiliensis TaxID=1470350 RepID=UPI0004857171|nr:GNAT family N-acetyltransferase [Candidatus Stoquefichus massiliensis]